MAALDDVREVFANMWREGYDGKDLAIAFAQVAVEVVRNERIEDLSEIRRLLD